MGFACFCCCPLLPSNVSHRVPALGEVCLAMGRAPYYAWARLSRRESSETAGYDVIDTPLTSPHGWCIPLQYTFTQKKALCLGCSWRDWFWKVLANLCCCQANSEEKRNIAQCSKTTRMYGPTVLRSKWPVHMFFSHSFRTMYQKHLQTWQTPANYRTKKSTSKRPGKPNRNAIKYLWRLSQNLCARPQCLCGMIASGQETFQNFSLKATNKHTQHHIPSLKLTYSSTWKLRRNPIGKYIVFQCIPFFGANC